MSVKQVQCPNCLAPLTSGHGKSAVCRYCGALLVDLPRSWWACPVTVPPFLGYPTDSGKQRLRLGQFRYVIDGVLGEGQHSIALRAHRDARLTELVVAKLARDEAGASGLRAEWNALSLLHKSRTQGVEHFRRLLPQPVDHGKPHDTSAGNVFASAFRWRPGFTHTVADVRKRYPTGCDPRAAIWILKRQLEMLTWVHNAGFVHGDICPEHAIVHPRAHGVVLVGWSRACRYANAAASQSTVSNPGNASADGSSLPSPRADIAAAVRMSLYVLADDGRRLPKGVPSKLVMWLRARANASQIIDNAWALNADLTDVSNACFGPPCYVPLDMDG